MKYFILLATVVALISCNTSIGLYRDTKEGFNWTKNKIQGTGGSGGYDDGAPVY